MSRGRPRGRKFGREKLAVSLRELVLGHWRQTGSYLLVGGEKSTGDLRSS